MTLLQTGMAGAAIVARPGGIVILSTMPNLNRPSQREARSARVLLEYGTIRHEGHIHDLDRGGCAALASMQ
jgi:hypothetical protein